MQSKVTCGRCKYSKKIRFMKQYRHLRCTIRDVSVLPGSTCRSIRKEKKAWLRFLDYIFRSEEIYKL